MDKPLELIINEFKKNIEDAINESKLSPTILEMLFKDIYLNIHNVAENYESKIISDYMQAQAEKEESENV